MYSFPYLELVCFSMSSSNCCFLTCIQISQQACQVVWYSHLFQNFPQVVVIHTVKGFGVVSEAGFSGILWLFYDPEDVANLISGSSAFSKSSLNVWKFSVHILLKPSLENFEHYFASMWNECNWEYRVELPNFRVSVEFSSVQYTHSVMSDSLRSHGLQHTRPPCPSPIPGVYSKCPSS